jgi:hypothetical protein
VLASLAENCYTIPNVEDFEKMEHDHSHDEAAWCFLDGGDKNARDEKIEEILKRHRETATEQQTALLKELGVCKTHHEGLTLGQSIDLNKAQGCSAEG